MANIKLALAGNTPVSSVASRAVGGPSARMRAASAVKGLVAAVNKVDKALAGYMADLAKARNHGNTVAEE